MLSEGFHHDGDHPDVVRDLLVWLVVPADFLLPVFFHPHGDPGVRAFRHPVRAGQREGRASVAEIELVDGAEGALRHRKVVDGVHQVRLPLPVVPADAVYVFRERELLQGYVPEILDDYFLQHGHISTNLRIFWDFLLFFSTFAGS